MNAELCHDEKFDSTDLDEETLLIDTYPSIIHNYVIGHCDKRERDLFSSYSGK